MIDVGFFARTRQYSIVLVYGKFSRVKTDTEMNLKFPLFFLFYFENEEIQQKMGVEKYNIYVSILNFPALY